MPIGHNCRIPAWDDRRKLRPNKCVCHPERSGGGKVGAAQSKDPVRPARAHGVLRLRSSPPSPTRNSAQDDSAFYRTTTERLPSPCRPLPPPYPKTFLGKCGHCCGSQVLSGYLPAMRLESISRGQRPVGSDARDGNLPPLFPKRVDRNSKRACHSERSSAVVVGIGAEGRCAVEESRSLHGKVGSVFARSFDCAAPTFPSPLRSE